MMCFGLKDRKRLKTNHCVIVLLDDTQLVHELHVSTRPPVNAPSILVAGAEFERVFRRRDEGKFQPANKWNVTGARIPPRIMPNRRILSPFARSRFACQFGFVQHLAQRQHLFTAEASARQLTIM